MLLTSQPVGGATVSTIVADEVILTSQLVALNAASRVGGASGVFTADKFMVAGVAKSGAGIGATIQIETGFGKTVAILFGSAPGAASNGEPVFLSSTIGQATLTPPDVVAANRARFFVGILRGADGVTTTPDVLFQPRLIAYRI